AVPGARADLDRAANLLQVAAHDVHAHAAARDVRHQGGRREAAVEDQVDRLTVGEPPGGVLAQHAALDGQRTQRVRVDAFAVIRNCYDDAVLDLARRDRDPAGLGLAGGGAGLGRLDAVVDGVADDVDQRIADRLDDRAV